MVESVKKRLFAYGIESFETDIIKECLEESEAFIKNFCNIEEICEALHYLVIDIAVGLCIEFYINKGLIYNQFASSIKEGDVTINFEGSVEQMKNVAKNLKDRKKELSAFRKIRWQKNGF